MLRERAGTNVLELELPEGARVSDALATAAVASLAAGLPLVMAVNREYADGDVVLRPGDELALIPPVSGGAGAAGFFDRYRRSGSATDAAGVPWHVRLTDQPLSLDAVAKLVVHPQAGAIVTFSGVTREVPSLEYEAYAEMAIANLRAIVGEAITRYGLCAAAAEHRIGSVPLSEPSVIVAASSPHRPQAFEGAREIIDRIKALAPIWKKEISTEGAEWVEGKPPGWD
jgi:molybdopterin synthase catalytic subunit/molybdopterin converting factor small subunit